MKKRIHLSIDIWIWEKYIIPFIKEKTPISSQIEELIVLGGEQKLREKTLRQEKQTLAEEEKVKRVTENLKKDSKLFSEFTNLNFQRKKAMEEKKNEANNDERRHEETLERTTGTSDAERDISNQSGPTV